MTRREWAGRWERWKKEQIASVPDDEQREWLQDLLGDLDPPTELKRMRELEKVIEEVFGPRKPRKRLRKGTGNGPSCKRRKR